MLKQTLKFVLFLLISNILYCQSVPIKGQVVDEQKNPLEFVSVALLKQKDSTLINYTITDLKGDFSITEAPKDSLIVQLSYMGFLTHTQNILYNNTSLDLKIITLKESPNVLDAVTISAVVPVQVKKDTIAFNAGSFKVNPDDNLETLLKKLPGLEIESDGKVIAQGNEVTKIYVDGKEFFGGDPAIVLKNLSADAIAKIEVIDKQSEESELTGVDDGNKQMVINFSLKKSKKNLGFGKFSAGMGLDKRYFSNLNYNKFNPKTQISVIGKFNNINITGSNIQRFLENANGIADESDENDDDFDKTGKRSLSGYLKTEVAGAHIGHEFKDKVAFNADYFYNLSDNSGNSTSKRVSYVNANNFNYESENAYDRVSKTHGLNFNYKDRASSTNRLSITGKVNSSNTISNSEKDGEFSNEAGELTTTNSQHLYNENDRKAANFNVDFYQKLKKPGRSFSTGFNTNLSKQDRINEQNTFVTRNIHRDNPSEREIRTSRDETFNSNTFGFNFKYTEPLAKNHYFKLQSFLKSKNDKEDIYQLKNTVTNNNEEELLTFKYKHLENSFQTRFAHNYVTDKLNIFSALELQDLSRKFGIIGENPININLFFLNPISTIQYKPKRGRKYRFSYRKAIRNPRWNESSTVINDLNPYFIRQGNPDLKAEKMDEITLNANIFNFKSSTTFFSRVQYQYSKNAIVQSIEIDDDFVRTRSFQNSGDRKRLTANFSFSKKVKGLGVRYTLKNRNAYRTSNSIINLQLNDVTSKDFMASVLLENTNKNVLDFKFGADYSINDTSFSLEEDLNRTYRKQQYFSMFDYDVSKKLSINTQFDYIVFTDNQFSSDLTLPIWSAAFSYNLTKNKNNICKLLLIDLLNKNVDVYRRSTTNYFEETTSESLGRYIILSYTYRLNKNQTKVKKRRA
ncbi:outer membrane beta-barrel protein [Seonamhaeicola maritimus]|uniref:outer membrane beta-barrel protein n=1 Tax=Seonamhaeicola maritimus TaxID=2591822 RepID=UPI002494BA5A|nr:outer membrane beta-barrel protein [Seonamhaeicola maritimus]